MEPPEKTPSSSGRGQSGYGLSRRCLLTTLGAGSTAAIAGCVTPLGVGEPQSLATPVVVEDSPTTHVWEFPRGANDENRIVQTYFDQVARVPANTEAADVRFRFGATVVEHSGYRHDQFTVRLRAPARLTGDRVPAMVLVEPAGTWEDFTVHREDQTTVITLQNLETIGTIEFDFLLDPRAAPTPETLGYDFAVTVENRGLINGGAVASDSGQISIIQEDNTTES